ncbi:MAG: hypothetical protein V4540_03460 [Pseudomonadota bacterium]
MKDVRRRGLAEWLIAACGVWLMGLGFYFIFLRPALLPEDLHYLGTDLQALEAAAPLLAGWLGKVFMVMGGFMAGAGVLVAYLGWEVMAAQPRGMTPVLALFGPFTLALMSAVNFALSSDFRWLLVVPSVVWATAVTLYELQGRKY